MANRPVCVTMRISTIRSFLTVLLLWVFYNEYLVYIIKTYFLWPPILCDDSKTCTKILIVADPQILGEQKENVFTRFDSDKFLSITFSLAYDYVKPDGVLFLGDLIDEGSQAGDEEFERYYHRFRNIFQLEKLYSSNVPAVFIAGDNDIGGEGNEVIRPATVRRFSKYFGKEYMVVIRNIKIFRVNRLLHTYSKAEDISLDVDNSTLNLVISHLPLTSYLSEFTSQVLRNLKPDFVLSAHEHKSYAVLTMQEDGKQLYYQQLERNHFRNGVPTWNFKTSRTTNFTLMTELTAPTCSYRMGADNVGYGVLVQNHAAATEITYHVLWLPERFFSLFLYVGLLVMTLLIASFSWYKKKCVRRSRKFYSHF